MSRLEACKSAASIPSLRAHAGRTTDPVDVVTPAFWALLRSDIDACAAVDPGPLWPDGEPDWFRPGQTEQVVLDSFRRA